MAMVLPAAGLALLVSGCQQVAPPVTGKDIDVTEKEREAPAVRITRYDKALEKLGLMLRAYNSPSINVQPKPITNDTAGEGVPRDIVVMVTTALGKIGDPVKVIPYDPAYELTQKELGKDILDRAVPDIIVSGAITEYDKDIVEKKRELKMDAQFGKGMGETNVSGGTESDASGGRIALDLRMSDYRTQQIITNVQTSNRIDVKKQSKGVNFNVAVSGTGGGFNSSVAVKEGLHAGLRLLVETSILELVGKNFNVPYWRCFDGMQPDESLISRYREALKDDSAKAAVKMKILAYTHGQDVTLDTADITEKDKQVIEKLKTQYSVRDDTDLIVELWKNVPLDTAAARLKSYRKEMAKAQQAAAQAEQAAAAAAEKGKTAEPAAAAAPASKAVGGKGKVVGFGKVEEGNW
jgi:curli biogenesis system outer membrane secretion channel CsgG